MSAQPLIAKKRVFIEGIYFFADDVQHQITDEDIRLSSKTIDKIRRLGGAIFSSPDKCVFNNQFTVIFTPTGKIISPSCCFYESVEFMATAEVFDEPQGKKTLFNDPNIGAIATGCFKKFPKDKAMHQRVKVVYVIKGTADLPLS
jgi:hypothetical protein